MTVRKVTCWPLEGTLEDDIMGWLALTGKEGQPLPGASSEWVKLAIKVAAGLQASLANDSDHIQPISSAG